MILLNRILCKQQQQRQRQQYLCYYRVMMSTSAAIRRAIRKSGAPKTVSLIGDEGIAKKDAAAFVRQIGCTRRVFLLKSYFNSDELEGLAYRIKALTKNDGINSVLIATDNTDDAENGALPAMMVDKNIYYIRDESVDEGFPPEPGKTYHVSEGYSPIELYKSGKYKDELYVNQLMNNMSELAKALKGDTKQTKVPTICIPHGMLTDGGFAFLLCSYVMATKESCYKILNPSRGLSLDPVGLSFVLPRLGQEFNQLAKDYNPGTGIILSLMGYEANYMDMLETGLVTHNMETPIALGLLEQTLAEIPPWNQQGLLKSRKRYYGDPIPKEDHNATFRNVQVADTINCFSTDRADGAALYTFDDSDNYDFMEDPSLVTDPVPWHQDRISDLVNYAATFDNVFQHKYELNEMLENLREISNKTSSDPQEQEGINIAADFVQRIERQSPLAVSVVYRLLQLGASTQETIDSCMKRERNAQTNLLVHGEDFASWAKYAVSSSNENDNEPFTGWKHKSIADVTRDEVTEIIEGPSQ